MFTFDEIPDIWLETFGEPIPVDVFIECANQLFERGFINGETEEETSLHP